MRDAIAFVPWPLLLAAVLTSCSAPPKPPTVDESLKRPANSPMALDLQVCRNDLQNTRILANESGRLADTTASTLASMAARQQQLAAMQARLAATSASPALANTAYTVRFAFGSARVVVPAATAAALVEEAKSAPLVLLRGRTDGTTDNPAESRIARERAAAVRAYLVAAGVDPTRIRATYQPAGDHVADNASATGRDMNRRVEIEVYRVLPVPLGAQAAAQP